MYYSLPRGCAAELSASGGAGVGGGLGISGDAAEINVTSYSERLRDKVPMPGSGIKTRSGMRTTQLGCARIVPSSAC
jgi:hypothetical protein